MSASRDLMISFLKSQIKKRPPVYAFLRNFYPPELFFKRLIRPAFFWPILRSVSPISAKYGFDRGKPVDRYFIEKFLLKNADHIRGVCLEVKDNEYTKRYGGGAVERIDILDINMANNKANIFGDLRSLQTIHNNTYDCIILTQVLQYIDNCEAAIDECYRILKPDGHLLVTLPSMGRIDLASGVEGDFWRFTTASARYLFAKHFPHSNLMIQSWGNVLAGVAFWIGLSWEDMRHRNLEYYDPAFPLIISVSAIK